MILLDFLPIIVLTLALWFGPLPIVTRAFVRAIAGPHHVHHWFGPVGVGLAAGMILAATGTAIIVPAYSLNVALLGLLFLLACIDWQWRWLPIEWTLAVAALAVIHGIVTGDIVNVFAQMLIPSLTLLMVRQLMSWTLGKEALGLGDIWLLLGLGGFLQLFETFLVVGLAALLGLVEVAVRLAISSDRRKSTGVSYGTHLCIVFLIFRNFPQIL